MAYDICLFLDQETESTVRRAWSVLRTRGISSPLLRSGGKPHLTLAIWEDLDPEPVLDDIADFADSHRTFPVTFSSFATFGPGSGTVFLGPVFTPSLIIVHHQLYRIMGELSETSASLYRPGSWVPHCSLTLGVPDEMLMPAMECCTEILELPIMGSVVEMGILKFEEDSIHSVRSYRLQTASGQI